MLLNPLPQPAPGTVRHLEFTARCPVDRCTADARWVATVAAGSIRTTAPAYETFCENEENHERLPDR